MKVLFVCADFGIPILGGKGSSVHVRELAAAFNRCGHQITIVAPVGSPDAESMPSMNHVDFMHIPLNKKSKQAAKLVKNYTHELGVDNTIGSDVRKFLYDQELEQTLLDRFGDAPPDLIYVRASPFSMAGTRLSEVLNRPLIVEMNAPIADEQARYRSTSFAELALAAERKLIGRADAVCCVSEELGQYVESLGIDPRRVHVLPNGVSPFFFDHDRAEANAMDARQWGDGPVLGFVGTMRPWHGMDLMPLLLKKLRPRYPGLKLVIVGTSPLQEDLYAKLAQQGLEECVIFVGARPYREIPALIRGFDIALAPYSIPDHSFYFSPMKVFEYMACGVPVIAARIGQIKDIVVEGENGLLYTPERLEELAGKCIRLLENPSFAHSLGIKAKQFIRENHTWDHNAERIISIFRSLC
jgi:glycosyltransferase involved in cell wall biosynthesis